MKRIGWSDLVCPGWNPFVRDLQDTFGAPLLWNDSVMTEPQLKSPHQWALGRHYTRDHPGVCVGHGRNLHMVSIEVDMTRTFYEKVGRRYYPASEYDPQVLDALPQGDHLISVRLGSESRRCRIDPALAPMIAAGLYAQDAIVNAIHDAQKLRADQKVTMTPRQLALMEELTESMNQSDAIWLRPSARDAAEAAVRVLQEEAQRRMRHPAVKKAYEDFLMVARLCGDDKENER